MWAGPLYTEMYRIICLLTTATVALFLIIKTHINVVIGLCPKEVEAKGVPSVSNPVFTTFQVTKKSPSILSDPSEIVTPFGYGSYFLTGIWENPLPTHSPV